VLRLAFDRFKELGFTLTIEFSFNRMFLLGDANAFRVPVAITDLA